MRPVASGGVNRKVLVFALVFGILSLAAMVTYSTRSMSLASLEAVSRELNNPIGLLFAPEETAPYVPLGTETKKILDSGTQGGQGAGFRAGRGQGSGRARGAGRAGGGVHKAVKRRQTGDEPGWRHADGVLSVCLCVSTRVLTCVLVVRLGRVRSRRRRRRRVH